MKLIVTCLSLALFSSMSFAGGESLICKSKYGFLAVDDIFGPLQAADDGIVCRAVQNLDRTLDAQAANLQRCFEQEQGQDGTLVHLYVPIKIHWQASTAALVYGTLKTERVGLSNCLEGTLSNLSIQTEAKNVTFQGLLPLPIRK